MTSGGGPLADRAGRVSEAEGGALPAAVWPALDPARGALEFGLGWVIGPPRPAPSTGLGERGGDQIPGKQRVCPAAGIAAQPGFRTSAIRAA